MSFTAKSDKRVIALFESARQVIKADEAVRKAGIEATVKPIPEIYSTECGMCIEFANAECEKFIEIVTAIGFTPQIYAC